MGNTMPLMRLQHLEPRLRSHADMGDRLARIETQLQTHMSKMTSLEARVDQPNPDQARVLTRINSKLDQLEEQQIAARRLAGREPTRKAAEPLASRHSMDSGSRPSAHLDAEMDRQERAKYLQARIEKLKELRSKYENAEMS